jgi:DNA-binding NarL/FixJ family response regulator
MYKVLIVDDHESVCDSLETALAATGEFIVAGRTPSAVHAEILCEKLRPDLVFMDICTKGEASGLQAIKTLREKFPGVKIIAMSGFDEISYAPRAQEAGAHAFVSKGSSLDCFIEAAATVMQGKTIFPDAKILSLPRGEVTLTQREMEILRLMCKPMTNKEIGIELGINEGTVKFHKANILTKTGFANSMDLAFYAITHGLINPLF